MTFLITLAGVRDVFIIIYSILGILFLIVLLALTVFIGLTVRGVIRQARGLIDQEIKPTLHSVRDTAESIKGTADFVGQTAVTPIIKTYSFVSGVRRGIGMLTGLRKRK
jgi:hypothetical protein